MEDNPSLKAMKDRIEAINVENKERDRDLKEKAEIAKNTRSLSKPEPKSKIITDKNIIEESLKDTVPASSVSNKETMKKALANLKSVLGTEVKSALAPPLRPQRILNDGLTQKQRILRQHGNKPSDIPVNSPYWQMKK